MLPDLEREEESVSTELAEEDMGLGGHAKWVYGSEKLDRCRERRAGHDLRSLTLTKRQGAREGSLDFGVRYL